MSGWYVSRERLAVMFPHGKPELLDVVAERWGEAVLAGINTSLRVKHFLARIDVETGGLHSIVENLNYSATRLTQVWPKRFPTPAAASPYAGNPEKLANHVYGGRLGNREPGDGWRFRGSGMLQTTGRDNFAKLGFEQTPDLLRMGVSAFLSAIHEWTNRGCNAMADRDDARAVCHAINGGENGLSAQIAALARAKNIFASPIGPEAPPAVPVPKPKPTLIEAHSVPTEEPTTGSAALALDSQDQGPSPIGLMLAIILGVLVLGVLTFLTRGGG